MSRRLRRPRGTLAQRIAELLEQEPLAARDLAERLQVPTRMVVVTCSRLLAGGHIRVVSRERLAGARRPLLIYGSASLERAVAQVSVDLAAIWR